MGSPLRALQRSDPTTAQGHRGSAGISPSSSPPRCRTPRPRPRWNRSPRSRRGCGAWPRSSQKESAPAEVFAAMTEEVGGVRDSQSRGTDPLRGRGRRCRQPCRTGKPGKDDSRCHRGRAGGYERGRTRSCVPARPPGSTTTATATGGDRRGRSRAGRHARPWWDADRRLGPRCGVCMIAWVRPTDPLPPETESRLDGTSPTWSPRRSRTRRRARGRSGWRRSRRRCGGWRRSLRARRRNGGLRAVAEEVGRLLGAEQSGMVRYEADGTR